MLNLRRTPLIVTLAGLACAAAAPQPQPPPPQTSTVFVDDSVAAADTIERIPELLASGNAAEAARVLQSVLEADADRVVPTPTDPDLFISVRSRLHSVLLSNPALLAKYREAEEPAARRLLDEGQHARVERSRLLTSSGFEACLRTAQSHLESARFDTAFLTLASLDPHPDRTNDRSRKLRAAELAALIARYTPRPDAAELARRWAADSESPAPDLNAVEPPPEALRISRDALADSGPIDQSTIGPAPLAAVPLSPQPSRGRPEPSPGGVSWLMPSVLGDTLLTNNGVEVAAWDRATLVPLWKWSPGEARIRMIDDGGRTPLELASRDFESLSSVSVNGGIALAVTGYAISGYKRDGDPRLHALDASSGKLLWSADPASLDPQIADSSIRGPALLIEDTAVVSLGRLTGGRRVAAVALAGLDASSGTLRWVRPLASIGVPPYNRPARPAELLAAADGVVYRADGVGVVGAYEASTGRPVWVRRFQAPAQDNFFRYTSSRSDAHPWAGAAPIIDANRLILLEPVTSDLLVLDRATGALIDRRKADVLGSPRYLVRVADRIALVGVGAVAFVPLSDPARGEVSHSPDLRLLSVKREDATLGEPAPLNLAGRAFAAGPMLAVPVETGIVMIDPANPVEPRLIALEQGGHALAADGQLVVATPTSLHSYQTWESAEPRLLRWIADRPTDPTPCLTYVEIASRASRPAGIPGVADKLLTIVEADPDNSSNQDVRRRLFARLASLIAQARQAAESSPQTQPIPGETLDALATRLARAADSDLDRAHAGLLEAWTHEHRGRVREAVEAYQRVILEPSSSSASIVGWGDAGAARPAWEIARLRLVDLLAREGYRPYEGFAAQAERELQDLGAQAGPSDLDALARRYPLARVAPDAFLRAADLWLAADESRKASAALGAALTSLETIARVSRQPVPDAIGSIAGRLVGLLARQGRPGEAFRLIDRLASANPQLSLRDAAGPLDRATLLEGIKNHLASQIRRPAIGTAVERTVHVIPGWTILRQRLAPAKGQATDQLPMLSLSGKQIALFAPNPEDGRLAPLWSRAFDESQGRPSVLRTSWDSTLLFWPDDQRGPRLELINTRGETLWTTPHFASLLPPGNIDNPTPLFTPLDGDVQPSDILVASDQTTVVLIERRGRAAAFDLASGKARWTRVLPTTAVYDAAIAAGRLVVAGIVDVETMPQVLALDVLTGTPGASVGGPDKPLRASPRWLRAGGDRIIIGLADSIASWNPADGSVDWSLTGPAAQRSVDAWIVDQRLILLSQAEELWQIDLATGVARDPSLRTAGRLGDLRRQRDPEDPGNTIAGGPGGSLVLASENGIACFDAAGELAGIDAAGQTARDRLVVLANDAAVMLEAGPESTRDGRRTPTLQIVSLPGGRMVLDTALSMFDAPSRIAVLDGKIVVSAGPLTLVLDAPLADQSDGASTQGQR
jgi:outer membrane protein assembly factor BamB